MSFKKIYNKQEVLVSEDLISSSDDVINEVLYTCEPGTIIYTAGYSVIKQKSIDNKWIKVSGGIIGGGSGIGGSSVDIATDEEVTEMLDKYFA